MSTEDFKRKLDELARRIMEETDPDTLGELMVEMDLLWRSIHDRSPPAKPQISVHEGDALRMYKPTNIDTQWARMIIATLSEGARMVFPNAELHYQISHKERTFTLMNIEQLNKFDSFVVHLQTIATFHAIGYRVMELRPITQ